ncbi:MAG: hypothetical protein K2O22_00680 [Anaeroplasmataceae bacterium]|nr:hypothetical protein [Anaeroplasmataceae bacterium]
MKKKVLLGAAVALSLFAATSCGESEKPWEDADLKGKTLNVYINYKGQMGVTYTSASPLGKTYQNPIDGNLYQDGDLLPTWKEVQTRLGVTIHDAVRDFKEDSYTKASDDDIYTAIKDSKKLNKIDVLMTNSANATKFAKDAKLVNLNDYMDEMPNLKAWLNSHPDVKKEITDASGKLYMAPYFDGVDTIEKMFLFNTEIVEKLVDGAMGEGDTTPVPAANTAKYEAFIDTSEDYTVLVSKNGAASDMTVKAATNPVTAQNELATKTGATYLDALKTYIDAAYGHEIGEGKRFTKRSEIFNSESACYSTDDMIALMRCAVYNPQLVLGDKYEVGKSEIVGIVPRGEANNRVITILQMAQIWGVRGLTSEKDYLYFDNDGKLKDARTTQATYDGLTKLNQLKAEGLIHSDWSTVPSSGAKGTKYYSYLNGTADGASSALMIYDYNATQSVNNKYDDASKIGTKNSIWNGLMPVLPPVTKWEDSKDNAHKYTRYTEDARAFKSAGSVIIAKDDENRIKGACKLIDYFYSKEGAELQDYGPAAYTDGKVTIAGVEYPKIKAEVFTAINDSGKGWNDWYRAAVGSTQGMGHIRTDGLDYQVTHPVGQVGLQNVLNAIKSGALVCATTAAKRGFGATVPAYYSSTPNTANIVDLVDFWKQGGNNTQWRKVINEGWETGQMAKLQALWEQSDNSYLAEFNGLLK